MVSHHQQIFLNQYEEEFASTIYYLELERLTTEPENESKKLMEFCELPWDKKCLEFYKRNDVISKTASLSILKEMKFCTFTYVNKIYWLNL